MRIFTRKSVTAIVAPFPLVFVATQDEPRDSPAFTRLGVMTIREERFEEGIMNLDKAIKLDPSIEKEYRSIIDKVKKQIR